MVRKIAVIVGSESDLEQCEAGLKLLHKAQAEESVLVLGCKAASIHRNTLHILNTLTDLASRIEVLIVGAGWANALTGMCDSYLRYELRNDQVVVIGVAFEDKVNPEHTAAAIASIRYVPGTQVVFKDASGEFVGSDGFLRACQFAVTGELPQIKLPPAKRIIQLTVASTLTLIQEQKQKRS